jgi:hypothetical protein
MSSLGSLATLIKLRFGDAFINQSFIVAATFLILIFARSHWHFMPGRTGQRIPAFRFRRRFKNRFFRVYVRFARQFPFGLCQVGHRWVIR